MSALQSVTLQFPSEPDCLELEGISMGERVLRAETLRRKAHVQRLSEELMHDTEALFWRRVCELLESRCTEVHS